MYEAAIPCLHRRLAAEKGGANTDAKNIFEQYLTNQSVFRDRAVLEPSYLPDTLLHREAQIERMASVLAPALYGERASNMLLFGNSGTGKTACAKYIGKQLMSAALPKGDAPHPRYLYVNCQTADTHYGVLYGISTHLFAAEEVEQGAAPPPTGWSLDRVYRTIKSRLAGMRESVVIVLDEVDMFVKKSGDDALYSIMKLNEEEDGEKMIGATKVSIIGISNEVRFTELLDPRVRSRLSDEKIQFPPYNVDQLADILIQRAKHAFKEHCVDESILSLCAAMEAKERGDARRAIALLRIAGEMADRYKEERITERHVKMAYNTIERDCVIDAVDALTTQSKHILLGIILNTEAGNDTLTTGDVYTTYYHLCKRTGLTPLSQRRVTDLISELDMQGLVNARVKSFGRGGRTKEISLAVPNIIDIKRTLEKDEFLSSVKGSLPKYQTKLV
ncbi:MAG: ORC1-type DNA replication protein [Candidatus Thermoplasmatota archaeon]